ncbi:hypothetical protein D3C78_1087210 [compost metagenome]
MASFTDVGKKGMTATVSFIGNENISSVPFMPLPKSSIMIATLSRFGALASRCVFVTLSLDVAAETVGVAGTIVVIITAATAIKFSK